MKVSLVALFFLVTGCTTLEMWSSPRFQGQVVNENGIPIDRVEIFLERSKDNSKLLTVTDKTGRFSFEPTKVTFTHIYGDPGTSGEFIFRKNGFKEVRVYFRYMAPLTDKAAPVLSQSDANKITMKR